MSIPSPPAGESRYLVLRNFPVTVGILGFEGLPNERGEVEIGYSVLPDHQRAGSASEAVAALTRWAFSHPWVRRVMAETYPELTASRRVLGKNEFKLAGEGSAERVIRFELARPLPSAAPSCDIPPRLRAPAPSDLPRESA